MKAVLASPLARSLSSSLIGFLIYGSWAAYANRLHGSEASLEAGLTQGTYSFIMTLILTVLMEWLFRRTGWVLITTLIVSLFVICTSYTVNWLAGTPEIMMTILPGGIISSMYTYSYLLGLRRFSGGLNRAESRS